MDANHVYAQPCKVRQVSIGDAEAVSHLSAQLGYEKNVSATAETIRQIIADRQHLGLVVTCKDEVVGWIHAFISIRLESASFCEIGGLVIDEGHRGRGYAGKLIGAVIAWAKEKDCKKLRLRSNVIRKDAHGFYLRFGFEEVKEQRVFDMELHD